MPDDHEDRFRQHEAIMESLARMLAEQRTFNLHMAGLLQEQRAFNAQQVAINQRLETLLERAWRSSPNGHTD